MKYVVGSDPLPVGSGACYGHGTLLSLNTQSVLCDAVLAIWLYKLNTENVLPFDVWRLVAGAGCNE